MPVQTVTSLPHSAPMSCTVLKKHLFLCHRNHPFIHRLNRNAGMGELEWMIKPVFCFFFHPYNIIVKMITLCFAGTYMIIIIALTLLGNIHTCTVYEICICK